jgi:acetolactate synthase I/II/III large subunit
VRNGAERLCDALEALGVEHVLGLPGIQNILLYEALRRSRIRPVVATHELAASFMAGAYYRASGKVAPLVTIPGPGFTYALTGLAEALHDSAAVVHLTVEPPGGERRFQFQAIDQRAIATPLVKGVLRAGGAGEIAEAVTAAVELALSGEPGPVLLELSAASLEGEASGCGFTTAPRAPGRPRDDIEEAAAFLARSRLPLVMAGQGCAGAAPGLRELAELLGSPVLTTISGRGVLPEDHPLALGFDPARGDVQELNELVARSDCLLAVGCKLTAAGTDGFAFELPEDRLIHVDAGPEVPGATYRARLSVTASAEDALPRLSCAVRRRPRDPSPRWTEGEVASWRRRVREPGRGSALEPAFHGVTPQTAEAFFAALQRALPRDAIVATDSGLHQTLARRHLRILSPRGLIVPSDFQSMGFGLPAAIGAKLAAPGRAVVAVIGDGGFLMSGFELLTAARERAPITLVVFNDGQLNRIRLQQFAQFGQSEGCDILNPDFKGFAEAIGARYALCEGDVEGILRASIAGSKSTVVEVRVSDSPAIHLERLKGLARHATRRAIGAGAFASLKRLLLRA